MIQQLVEDPGKKEEYYEDCHTELRGGFAAEWLRKMDLMEARPREVSSHESEQVEYVHIELVVTEPRVERAQAEHVAVLEPLVAAMHSQADAVLCGQVTRDVQLVAFSCYCSPASTNEVEARLEGLDHMHQGQCRCYCCESRHLKVSKPGLHGAAAVHRRGLKHALALKNVLLEFGRTLR